MKKVKINHITYNVMVAKDADAMEADGCANIAKRMRESGIALDLIIQRPKGNALYHALQHSSGTYSNLTKF